jgi:hypothetical protein
MPLSSVYLNCLNAVALVLENLGLSFTPDGGGPTIIPGIVVLKEPTVQEYLQTLGEPGETGSAELPVIVVSPQAEKQPTEPASVEAYVFVTYPVDITISAGGNRDFQSNLDTWLNWRETIRGQFMGTLLPGVPQVYDTNTDPEEAVDRETLQDNLDQSALTVRFETLEARAAYVVSTTTTTTSTTTTSTTTTSTTTTT